MAKTPTAKTPTAIPAVEADSLPEINQGDSDAISTPEAGLDEAVPMDGGFVNNDDDTDSDFVDGSQPEVDSTDEPAAEATEEIAEVVTSYQDLPGYRPDNETHIRIHAVDGGGFNAICRNKEVWVKLDKNLKEVGLLNP